MALVLNDLQPDTLKTHITRPNYCVAVLTLRYSCRQTATNMNTASALQGTTEKDIMIYIYILFEEDIMDTKCRQFCLVKKISNFCHFSFILYAVYIRNRVTYLKKNQLEDLTKQKYVL
jgi:hypothetical protein